MTYRGSVEWNRPQTPNLGTFPVEESILNVEKVLESILNVEKV